MDKLSVNISILERVFKLTIDASDEVYLRKAANLIETQVKEYSKAYGHKDNQDLLSMVALSQITQLVKLHEDVRYKDNDMVARLSEMDSFLTEALGDEIKSE